MSVNRQWCVGARPEGKRKPSDFLYEESQIPSAGEGEVLLETLYLGIAPVMRMYMMNAPMGGEPALAIGDVIHGRGVARVLESHHRDYEMGEIVQGQLGRQTYKVSKMTPRERFLKVKHYELSYAHSVRILSMTGLTAYTSFMQQGQPKAGDVVVVSGATGGVGHMVVQMAKIKGCHVIGIAGGPEKCAIVKGLGADSMIDYKNEDVPARIAELCPDGMDIYYGNVGGEILKRVWIIWLIMCGLPFAGLFPNIPEKRSLASRTMPNFGMPMRPCMGIWSIIILMNLMRQMRSSRSGLRQRK